ncbi:hypothetical protein CHS0354_015151 [Potamilus streckersoni]|uniref:Uncharacterized protein n=1 Tax=Potamilus streckersoni TaxID=2493646 RepID=A0AAE0SDF5_9BIVA|nr:hypothetical protein CHS0354_015151 [Potamilus streckersoni]
MHRSLMNITKLQSLLVLILVIALLTMNHFRKILQSSTRFNTAARSSSLNSTFEILLQTSSLKHNVTLPWPTSQIHLRCTTNKSLTRRAGKSSTISLDFKQASTPSLSDKTPIFYLREPEPPSLWE